MYVQTTTNLLAQAIQAIGTGGPFNAAKIALFHTAGNVGRTKTLADFTITDFGGLTNLKSLTWGAPFINQNQQAEVMAGNTNWLTVTAVLLPITVLGYVIVNTAGDTLLLAELFPVPIVFDHAGQNFGGVPRLVWDT